MPLSPSDAELLIDILIAEIDKNKERASFQDGTVGPIEREWFENHTTYLENLKNKLVKILNSHIVETPSSRMKRALEEIQVRTIDPEIEAIAARAIPESQRPQKPRRESIKRNPIIMEEEEAERKPDLDEKTKFGFEYYTCVGPRNVSLHDSWLSELLNERGDKGWILCTHFMRVSAPVAIFVKEKKTK